MRRRRAAPLHEATTAATAARVHLLVGQSGVPYERYGVLRGNDSQGDTVLLENSATIIGASYLLPMLFVLGSHVSMPSSKYSAGTFAPDTAVYKRISLRLGSAHCGPRRRRRRAGGRAATTTGGEGGGVVLRRAGSGGGAAVARWRRGAAAEAALGAAGL